VHVPGLGLRLVPVQRLEDARRLVPVQNLAALVDDPAVGVDRELVDLAERVEDVVERLILALPEK
jgi:hypothetical protein